MPVKHPVKRRVPIAILGNIKRPTISQGHRVHIGPSAPPVKKEQHQVQPPIVLAAIAALASTKVKVNSLELLVPRGTTFARLEKK